MASIKTKYEKAKKNMIGQRKSREQVQEILCSPYSMYVGTRYVLRFKEAIYNFKVLKVLKK